MIFLIFVICNSVIMNFRQQTISLIICYATWWKDLPFGDALFCSLLRVISALKVGARKYFIEIRVTSHFGCNPSRWSRQLRDRSWSFFYFCFPCFFPSFFCRQSRAGETRTWDPLNSWQQYMNALLSSGQTQRASGRWVDGSFDTGRGG